MVKLQPLKTLTLRLLQAEGCGNNTEVSILLTSDESIKMLNRDYREVDSPTDVLSFSQVEGEGEFAGAGDSHLLGDVVISVDSAARQAEQRGVAVEEEVRVLLVHGLLHLLGYDHAEPEDERVMFARQDDLLKMLA